jgi:hypothetical protein
MGKQGGERRLHHGVEDSIGRGIRGVAATAEEGSPPTKKVPVPCMTVNFLQLLVALLWVYRATLLCRADIFICNDILSCTAASPMVARFGMGKTCFDNNCKADVKREGCESRLA